MLDGPLIFQVNLPVVDTIHPCRNKFVTAVKIKATNESKLSDSPVLNGKHLWKKLTTEVTDQPSVKGFGTNFATFLPQ